MAGKTQRFSIFIENTPTVTASSAYSSGNQVGGIQTLISGSLGQGSAASVVSVSVIDFASQNAALTIFFFDDLPVVASTDKAALDITDAEMQDKCVGFILVPAANYQAVANSSIATVLFPNLYIRSQQSAGNIYAVVKTTGTPTYTGTTDLTFKYSFIQD